MVSGTTKTVDATTSCRVPTRCAKVGGSWSFRSRSNALRATIVRADERA